jgi:hypothetical protein
LRRKSRKCYYYPAFLLILGHLKGISGGLAIPCRLATKVISEDSPPTAVSHQTVGGVSRGRRIRLLEYVLSCLPPESSVSAFFSVKVSPIRIAKAPVRPPNRRNQERDALSVGVTTDAKVTVVSVPV